MMGSGTFCHGHESASYAVTKSVAALTGVFVQRGIPGPML
jgi:hypothetical protein